MVIVMATIFFIPLFFIFIDIAVDGFGLAEFLFIVFFLFPVLYLGKVLKSNKIEVDSEKLTVFRDKKKKTILLSNIDFILYSSFYFFNKSIKREDVFEEDLNFYIKRKDSLSDGGYDVATMVAFPVIGYFSKKNSPVIFIKEKNSKGHLVEVSLYWDRSIRELMLFLKNRGIEIKNKLKEA